MNNAEFYKNFVFVIYKFHKYNCTDNATNDGAPSNFVAMMLKGSAVIKTKSSALEIKEGDIFFIPKNLLYHSYWYGDENDEIEFLSLSAQNLPLKENLHFTLQKLDCTSHAKDLLNRFFDDLTVNCKTVGLFYSFLGEVVPNMQRDPTHHELILEKALHYIYSNPSAQAADIAESCNISEPTLYNIFKKSLNKTPNDVKQQVLCEKAVALLTTTSLSVEEISTELQFSSSSYFRKILKKHTNKTPSTIRKETSI